MADGITRIALGDELDTLDYRRGSGGTVEIYDIAVRSERRKGHGRKLLELLFRTLPPETNVWAITRAENALAQRFYEGTGFTVVGVLRRFYTSERTVDAIMYGRKAGG